MDKPRQPGADLAVRTARPSAVDTNEPPERDVVFCVLGNVSRTGDWVPPEIVSATSWLGDVKLDFTEASLPSGITEVDATAILGSVEIKVPRHVEVDLSGYSFLGSLEHRVQTEPVHEKILNWFRGDRSGRGEREIPAGPPPRALAAADEAEEPVVLVIRGFAVLGNVSIKRV